MDQPPHQKGLLSGVGQQRWEESWVYKRWLQEKEAFPALCHSPKRIQSAVWDTAVAPSQFLNSELIQGRSPRLLQRCMKTMNHVFDWWCHSWCKTHRGITERLWLQYAQRSQLTVSRSSNFSPYLLSWTVWLVSHLIDDQQSETISHINRSQRYKMSLSCSSSLLHFNISGLNAAADLCLHHSHVLHLHDSSQQEDDLLVLDRTAVTAAPLSAVT